jgi:hypothetical protein
MRDVFRTGIAGRRADNALLRARGTEPVPGLYAGVKRFARWIRRANVQPIRITSTRAPLYQHRNGRYRLALWRKQHPESEHLFTLRTYDGALT